MKIDEFCSSSGMPMPADDVLLSAAYLESKNFKFLKDYGTENAVEVAARVMQRERAILNFSKATKVCRSLESSSQLAAVLSVAPAAPNTVRRTVMRNRNKRVIKAHSLRRALARRHRMIRRRPL